MWHVVDSGELSIDSCGLVENGEILIYCNRAPMRNINVSASSGEKWKWVRIGEEDLDLIERDWSQVVIRSISIEIGISRCWFLRLILDILGLNSEFNNAFISRVNTQEIFGFKKFNGLFLVNSNNLWVWLSSTFMELLHNNIFHILVLWQPYFEDNELINSISRIA